MSADGTSPYTAHVAHPSEESTVPLVASVAAFSLLPNQTSPAHVAICAVATHEEQFLPEWLTWHRLVGVERFYLFDNSPSLAMRRLLRPWIQEGSVVLYELEYQGALRRLSQGPRATEADPVPLRHRQTASRSAACTRTTSCACASATSSPSSRGQATTTSTSSSSPTRRVGPPLCRARSSPTRPTWTTLRPPRARGRTLSTRGSKRSSVRRPASPCCGCVPKLRRAGRRARRVHHRAPDREGQGRP